MNKETLLKLRDPKFYLENFCKVKGKVPGKLVPFILKEHQKDLFNTVRNNPRVIILKARQMGFCLHEDTKVLMANLTWKKIKDVVIDDEVIAIDEKIPAPGKQRKMKTARVEKTFAFETETLELTFSDGRVIIATPEHRLLSKKWECSTDTVWKKVSDMEIGTSVRAITNVWGKSGYKDGWFGGMIDGEGFISKSSRSGVQVTISQVRGDVWDRLISYVNKNKISYRVEIDKRKAGDRSNLGSKEVYKVVINKMDELFSLLGKTAPSRLRKGWWEGKALPNNGWIQVVKIKRGGKTKVVDLQTSCGTYVAEGIVSHNSTAMVGFMYHSTITVPGTTTALIGYNSDLTAELLDKVKTFYKTTPDELKPTIHYNSKYEISFPSMDSKILVLPSTENVGRGYTLSNVLCVSGETEVFYKNGFTKKVKDVKDGDYILNGKGGLAKVKKVIKKSNNKRLLRIKIVGNDDLVVTEDHEVLVRGTKVEGFKPKWKVASALTKEDRIGYPYFQCRNKYKKVKINNFIKKGYKSRSIDCLEDIDIDYKFGLFVGWYLAKGYINQNKTRIVFCINENEIETILSIVRPFEKYFGKIRTATRKDSLSTTITLEGANFTRFIDSIFGRTENKVINDCIWYWGWNFGYGLLDGLFAGDGYVKNLKKVQLTNVNKQLIYQVKKLIISLRIGMPGISHKDTNRHGKATKHRYDLTLHGKSNYKFRRKFNLELPVYDNGRARWVLKNMPNVNQGHGASRKGRFYFWSKITGVLESEHEKYVYDIVMEKSPHSFLTKSGTVHNCTELASWDKADEKMMTLEASVPINGRMVIESTPSKGVGTLYHRMWMSDNNGYVKKQYDWWWDYSKEEIEIIRRRMNDPRKFAAEYGCKFLASGRSVFDTSIIEKQMKNVWKDGQEIVYENGEKFTIYKDDGLRIYREPENGHIYSCGTDVSEGIEGGDYSAATIWDRETGEEVAMYRGLIPPDIFGKKLNKWGRKYNNALMVVEINNHGLTTITSLKHLLYPTLYFRPKKFETMGISTSDKLGWKTTKMTRPILIDDFAEAIRDEDLIIHSKELLDEMLVFIYNDNGDMVAQSGFHDDSLFSAAIGIQGFKVLSKEPQTQLNYEKYLPKSFSY